MKGYNFDKAKHCHTYDGKTMIGVTKCLSMWGDSSALVNWAANQAVEHIEENALRTGALGVTNEPPYGVELGDYIVSEDLLEEARTAHTRKRDKAGDRGTEVHAQLEVMMNNMMEGKDAVYEPIVEKVRDWIHTERIKPLKSEMPVYSVDKFYAGIADGVIEKDGKKYILDFKTSGTVQTKAFIQCGAYSLAIKDMKKDAVIDGVVVVHIPKGESFNPEKNVYWFCAIEELEAAWVSILSAYKTDKTLQKLIKW